MLNATEDMNFLSGLLSEIKDQNDRMLDNQEKMIRLLENGLDPYVQGVEGVSEVMKVSKSFVYQNKHLIESLTPRHVSQKITLYKRDDVYKLIEGTKER